MADQDEEAHRYYADPDNRQPAGPGKRRTHKPMSSHVPVRFRPDVIAQVKRIAQEDRKTVSAWIRDVVEREIERRRPQITETRPNAIVVDLSVVTGPEWVTPNVTVA